jgi:glycosyltransferase involved in cell wall biosynthesis
MKNIKKNKDQLIKDYQKMINEQQAIINHFRHSKYHRFRVFLWYLFRPKFLFRVLRNKIITFFLSNYLELGNLEEKKKKVYFENFYKYKYKVKEFKKIVIVTPSFNQGKFIEETIKSVLKFNYPNLIYVIQDNFSTDKTKKILRKYEMNKKVRIFIEKDKGQADALNAGFSKYKGDIYAYLNTDDVLVPGVLYFVNYFFLKNKNIDLIYSHRAIINENNQIIGRWILAPNDNCVNKIVDFIPQETIFWSNKLHEKIVNKYKKPFNDKLKFAMDWDFILKAIKLKANFKRIPFVFSKFRVHNKSKTISVYKDIGVKEVNKLRKKYLRRTRLTNEDNKIIQNYVLKSALFSLLYDLGINI